MSTSVSRTDVALALKGLQFTPQETNKADACWKCKCLRENKTRCGHIQSREGQEGPLSWVVSAVPLSHPLLAAGPWSVVFKQALLGAEATDGTIKSKCRGLTMLQ